MTVKNCDALEGYVDVDYVGNIDTRKSLLCFVFTLFGTVVTWKTNQQSVIDFSTTQPEYIALVFCLFGRQVLRVGWTL